MESKYFIINLTEEQKRGLEALGFSFKPTINNIKKGDMVKIKNYPIKDAYGDVWHDVDNIEEVQKITSDGEGILFSSDLGTHYTNVERI